VKVLSDLEIKADATPMTIRQLNTRSLATLVVNGDKTEAKQFVKEMILMIFLYFGASINDYQLREVANEFYGKYFYWQLADFKLFVKRCRQLYYGEVYPTITISKLMEWANKYDDEWLNTSVDIHEQKHGALTYDPDRERELYNAERIANERKADGTQKMKDLIDAQKKTIEKYKSGDI